MKVDPNLNVILTACLTVYVGCYRSVKPTPPSETMSNEHAMRFPFVGSAMLLSLFLLFKFLSKDLVNAVLTCYFFVLGIIALSATLLPAIRRYLPKHWNDDPIIWHFPYFRCDIIQVLSSSHFVYPFERFVNDKRIKHPPPCCGDDSTRILAVKGRFLPKSSRSLRQEDPLSTYLFILAMETLSCILLRAKEGGFIDGFLVRGRDGEGMEISHLLFVDDTLIFCDASKENIEYPSCKVGVLPTTYLGLLLGAPYKSSIVWEGMKVRFQKRKYGQVEGGWCTKEVREGHGVWVWKAIRGR
ncbi:Signal peptide peptidase [Vitis vinifera]|uniref:Signal peptide peptidase n=1 Tax=Vitis vinifera TaxID=29760 RepID=A0A438KG40_VITVI|nr:Signal peptide peptidase [Vitis vinifera]